MRTVIWVALAGLLCASTNAVAQTWPVLVGSAGVDDLLVATSLPIALGGLFIFALRAWQAKRYAGVLQREGRTRYYGVPTSWAVLVMCLGLIATLWIAVHMRLAAIDSAQSQFAVRALEVERSIHDRFAGLGRAMNGVRGVFVASNYVSRQEFRQMIDASAFIEDYPGLHGLGFTERVPRNKLGEFVARQRSEGMRDFSVRTAGDANELFIVKYLEPQESNGGALGFDIRSETLRREVAEMSMKNGQIMLTERISLEQDPAKRPATLLMLPLYKVSPTPVMEAQRARALYGWVVAPLVFQEWLAVGSRRDERWTRFQLHDRPTVSDDSRLFDSTLAADQSPLGPRSAAPPPSRFSALRPLTVFNRVYYLQVDSTPAFDANVEEDGARQIAVLGASLSVLGAMVAWLLLVGRLRAFEMAQRLTHDLNRLALVAKRTSNAVVFAGPDRLVNWVNEGFVRLFGYQLEDVDKRPFCEVLQCELNTPEVAADVQAAVQQGRRLRCQFRMRCKDGTALWLEMEIQPLLEDEGQLNGFMAVLTNVSPEVQVREALQREKERVDNILSGTNVGTWESNLVTGESNWNQRWSSMLGFAHEEVQPSLDAFWQSRLHPEDRPRILNGIERCVQGLDEKYAIDVRARRKDGSWVWILSSAKVMSRMPDGQVEWIGGVHTDITESKLVELNLRDTEAFLDRAGHVSGVGGWQYSFHSGEIIVSEQVRLVYGFEPGYRPSLRAVFRRYPAAERKRLRQAIDHAVHSGTAWDMVLVFRTAAVADRWVRLFGEVEYDDSGAARLVGAFQDVTREYSAQLEVKRTGDMLRGAIDVINEAFVVFDPQDRLVFCNDKYRALYAKSADLMVPGVQFETLIRLGAERGQYVEAIGRVDEWVQERLALHQAANTSTEQRLENGRWLKVVERRTADGHIVGFRVDITELKTAVAEAESATLKLAQEQKRLQDILEGTRVGTWEWNIQTGEMLLSDQWASLLGYRVSDLQPLSLNTWLRLIHPQDQSESSQRMRAHLRGETPIYEAEVRMRHHSGHWVWILLRGKLIRWQDDGKPHWVSGTQMDISTRKQAEQALAETSATLQSVLDSAVDVGIVTTDLARTIRIFNRGAEKLLGYSAEEAVGHMTGGNFFDPREMAALHESLELVLGRVPTPQETFEHVISLKDQGEWTLVRKDQSRFMANLLFSSLRNAAGELVGHLVIIYDVSKQKEYEASLREAMQLAEQSSVAKSQFLANMSHEIRTPMNAILGMLQLMRNTPLSPRQRDYADKTEGAARSLLGLLNDILDFSKVEAGKMQISAEPFQLEDLLMDLSVILSSNLGDKNVDLIFDIDAGIPSVLVGDALRLKQILINLAGNAVKFTQQGQVLVRWLLLGQSQDRVRVRVSIADTGIGIAPENQARIFEGFTQAEANTTRRFGGTGLGLVISARLVSLMGGSLELQSALGQGTTFSFVLDLPVVEPGLQLSPAEAQGPDTPGPVHRVLLVDDNPDARSSSAALMRQLGWEVLEAASGAEALERVKSDGVSGDSSDKGMGARPLHAFFVDLHMPDMDGLQTLQSLRALVPAHDPQSSVPADAPRCILLSSQNREALAKRSAPIQPWLDAVMVKPLTARMFQQAIVDAHGQTGAHLAARSAVPEGPGRLAAMRILLVEDNPINQQVAYELLHGEGAQVRLADNGQLGIDALNAASQPFDVVLMDLQMPVMDGLTAARLLRRDRRWDALPIIAMTANAMASDREACLAAGMNDHVGKPFDLNDLVSVLQRHTGWQASGLVEALPQPGQETQPGPEKWPDGIDVAAALSRMGGNRTLLQRAVLAFVKDAQVLPQRLRHWQETQDFDPLRRELHALKGLCSTLGLNALATQAAAAENASKQSGQSPSLREALLQLWPALESVIPGLIEVAQRLVPAGAAVENLADSTPSAHGETLDAQQRSQLKALHQALLAQDMAAMETHAALRQTVPDSLAQEFEALDAAMAELEFGNAAKNCEILLARWS